MGDGISYPGVYVEELPGGARPIAGVSTSTTAFVGVAKDGPVCRPVAIDTFGQFEACFGGLDRQSELGYAVRQFFLNGGREAIVVRMSSSGETDDLTRAVLGDRTRREGLYALESVDIFNLLCLPGITDPAVLAAAAAFCRERRALLIADAPAVALTPDDVVTFVAGPDMPRTDHAALYYPWISVPDPLDGKALRPAPPSGTIAGLFARTDAAFGVWTAPAGRSAQLMNVGGLARPVTDEENRRLNGAAVNCLRAFPELGPVCWGARTLLGDDAQGSEWKYVSVRRMALYVEQSIDQGLDWAVFEPNDEPLWSRIRASVAAFLHSLFRQGAFQGRTQREAYFVRCDATTTTQSDIDSGTLNVIVGFAPVKPAEFVILTFGRRAGDRARRAIELTRVPARATFGDLALPAPALQQLRDLTQQVRNRQRAGLALFKVTDPTVATIAAEAIANELAWDLYRVDLRRVISKYVGETEKNLDRLMTAAEAVGGILLFDEADALFGRRTEVQDSHDRYGHIEIDYLLQRLESLSGLVILVTNATDDMSSPARSRFPCIDLTPQ